MPKKIQNLFLQVCLAKLSNFNDVVVCVANDEYICTHAR